MGGLADRCPGVGFGLSRRERPRVGVAALEPVLVDSDRP